LKRVSLQWSDEDKESMADYIIQNNSDLENLEKEAKKIFSTLL
jgi:dephospho-CoA kinase